MEFVGCYPDAHYLYTVDFQKRVYITEGMDYYKEYEIDNLPSVSNYKRAFTMFLKKRNNNKKLTP